MSQHFSRTMPHWPTLASSLQQLLYPGVNFIKNFRIKVFRGAFLESQFAFEIFWRKNIGEKAVHKMLMKLTTGVNFSSTFYKHLSCTNIPKVQKKTVKLSVFLHFQDMRMPKLHVEC